MFASFLRPKNVLWDIPGSSWEVTDRFQIRFWDVNEMQPHPLSTSLEGPWDVSVSSAVGSELERWFL